MGANVSTNIAQCINDSKSHKKNTLKYRVKNKNLYFSTKQESDDDIEKQQNNKEKYNENQNNNQLRTNNQLRNNNKNKNLGTIYNESTKSRAITISNEFTK